MRSGQPISGEGWPTCKTVLRIVPPPRTIGFSLGHHEMLMTTIAGDFPAIVSGRLLANRVVVVERWLARLKELLPVEPNEVFPSDEILDHIPTLVGAIAAYLRAPADEEIAANAAVIDKARELGALRHAQRASVHQLLREYEILAEILEAFVVEETVRLALNPSAADCFDVLRRLNHAVRTLMRTTVDTFISEYTTTIERQTERITTFNRAVSHELRSPIGTILFAATLLDRDGESVTRNPERLARIAATIRGNAERLGWLVGNLQRMVHLSEPLDVPSEQQVDVAAVASEVVRQLEDMAAARGVSVRVGTNLPTLIADPARLELVLLNLVSNGIKYSDPAKPDSYVEIAAADDQPADPGHCTIVVRDNGLGIPEEHRGAVFERFFRAHAGRDAELGVTGSGLGLAIVAECIEALHGSIRCESAVGTGTSFFVSLPCEQRAA
jgi:signal transduction histidine kinase